MASKPVKVVIDGEEFVSKAAESADKSMAGFAGKVPGYAKVVAGLAVAYSVVSAAVSAVKDFVVDSFAAFDAYSASQNKMAAQSKLTGVSMADLEKSAKRAREEFGLGAVVANEAATTTAKYAARAGDASKQNELLAAALNLGAASGLTAAESMEALNLGLKGQDEGFNKLGLSDPSKLWKDYADANGLAVGKMTEAQKRMAELTAVVDAGSKVGDTYNERLKSAAGQQELMNNKMENAKVQFGEALQPVRMLVIGGLSKLIEIGTPVVVLLANMANTAGLILGVAFQDLRESVANVAIVFGKLTGNKDMQSWGEQQADAANAAKLSIYAMANATKSATTTVTEHSTAVKASTAVAETESKKQDAAWQKYLKEYEAGLKRINDMYDAYLKLLPKLQPALEASMQTVHIEGQNRALKASKEAADAAMKALREGAEPLPALITKSSFAISDMGGKLATSARTALDVAQSFGAMDDSTAATLTSVINLGESIAKVAGGDMSAIPGMIASAANLISKMIGGDSARKKLIADNTTEMARLRSELGNLSLNVSGSDFASIRSALGEVIPQLRGGRGAANQADVINALARRGLGFGDLKKLADQLGIRITSDSGAMSVDGIKQLFEAMGLVELGKFGQDYQSQKQSVTAGFGVNQTGDVGQIGALGTLGGRFSSLLQGVVDTNDLAGSRSRLASLFAQMNAGGLSPDQLGGLSGSEFLDLITDLISRIDNLSGATGSTGSTGAGDTSTGGTVTSGGVIVPTKTLSDVLDGVHAQTAALGAYHVKHLDIATEHLSEAKMQTGILLSIAENTAPLREGITAIADKGLESERLALAAERGFGASY